MRRQESKRGRGFDFCRVLDLILLTGHVSPPTANLSWHRLMCSTLALALGVMIVVHFCGLPFGQNLLRLQASLLPTVAVALYDNPFIHIYLLLVTGSCDAPRQLSSSSRPPSPYLCPLSRILVHYPGSVLTVFILFPLPGMASPAGIHI